MKIAFIVGTFPSLSETFILNQITGLMELGHDIEIFSLLKSKEDKRHEIIDKLDLMKKVRFFPEIPKNSFLRLIKGKYLFFKNFYKDPKKIIKSINFLKWDKDFLSLKVLYYLIPFLGKKFDVIYSHFGNNGIIGVYLKKGGISGKYVTTFHGYDLSVFINQYGNSVYSQLFDYCDLCMSISNYWSEMLKKLGCPEEKIKLHRMGIKDEYSKTKGKDRKGKRLKLLTVGRLVEKKGHKYSIKAVSDLINEGFDLEYMIAGDGPLLNSMRDYSAFLKNNNRITFLGECTNMEIMDLYTKSDIFILHSITPPNQDKEGIPVVLMEAMLKGLPVISTFHSGIPELVANNESGFLVNEKDVPGIKNSIKYFIDNREAGIQMGKRGREIVKEEFNIVKQNKKLEKVFTELISQ